MKAAYLGSVLGALAISCAHVSVSPPPLPPPEVLLPMPWESGMPAGQDLADVAEMLALRIAEKPLDENGEPMTPGATIREWVTEFCILNGWPVPECGRPIYQRLRELIVNRA